MLQHMNAYYQQLQPGQTYHFFSRAVGNENLFATPENYRYFLQKLKQHTAPVCDLYAYALLPNHFHLLARIQQPEALQEYFRLVKKKSFDPLQHHLPDFIMERFSNFLNSYTKAFNKKYNRKGSLFMDYLKRSPVNQEADFTTYIWYIHKNPVHHGLAKTIGEWLFDSYASLLSQAPTALLRTEVLEWFGGREAFVRFHLQPVTRKHNIFDI